MKPTHLITLSALVKKLRNSRIDYQSHVEAIEDYDLTLDSIVRIWHFVACRNGVPLEKRRFCPKPQESQIQCNDSQPCECEVLSKQYNEAQKHVIFEGWELVEPNRFGDIVIHNKGLNTSLEFLENGINCKVYFGLNQSMNKHVKSLADLAAATTENPKSFEWWAEMERKHGKGEVFYRNYLGANKLLENSLNFPKSKFSKCDTATSKEKKQQLSFFDLDGEMPCSCQ